MVNLLDINLLIALAWPSHVHHDLAHAWLSENREARFATCPLTQIGFVRISSNPRIIPDAVMPQEALAALERIVTSTRHVFWPDDFSLLDVVFPNSLLVGHRQVTDAYLLGLAIKNDGRLVTLDRGVTSLLPPDSPHLRSLCVVSET